MNEITKVLLKKREEFLLKKGKYPRNVYLSKKEMKNLSDYLQNGIIIQREKDLHERLRPDLLPTIKEIQPIKKGDLIFGMCIKERKVSEIYLS